jgi:hypothetical protein
MTRGRAQIVCAFLLMGSLLLFLAPEHLSSRDSIFAANDSAPASYRIESPPPSAANLRSQYEPEQIALLEKLNRADAQSLPRLKVLVIPERWDLAELSYSPLPRKYPSVERYPKFLVVYLPGQVFGGYEFGRLVRWGAISSGGPDNPTQPGLFHLNWKSAGRHSSVDPEWYMRWYYNFSNSEGQAFHAYSLPGYPASHTCIRLLSRDARWLYFWGDSWELGARPWEILESGTPVLILGRYPFGQLPPWRSPEWLAQGIELPVEIPSIEKTWEADPALP